MEFLWSLTAFIITSSLLVIVHEFGHFYVARLCGIHVERFSIGFGKILWRVNRYGTEFVISLIPLGGYIKMLDERVSIITPENMHLAFNNKTIGQRIAVISAGPIANFLLSMLLYWLVFILGVNSVKPIISDIQEYSLAAQASFEPGMELKSIDDIEIHDWNSARIALISKIGNKELIMKVLPIGHSKPIKKTIDLRSWNFDPDTQDPILSLGIMPISLKQDPIIHKIQDGSAAELSGLQIGDKIIKINEQIIDTWHPVSCFIKQNPNIPLLLSIDRQGEIHQIILTPIAKNITKNKQIGFAGLELSIIPYPDEYKITQQYNLFSAFYHALNKTWQMIKFTLSMISKLITGDIKLTNLSGPISFAKGAGISAESGLVYYFMFVGLISINLGIINLIPLPTLDGGHLLFLLIEKIKGSPISNRILDISYRIGAIILILLMMLAIFNDFSRL
ncbi:Regulator of sigma-E protease RseP [Candidatus Arsenophonus lipoptenae]|uniref:Zinc metalloprotease n=2 Tax=Morganellaceae TaxID=1903414 RepID=A0A109QDX5_9GAMM|nr:Regulator of sigma-E protease RseP [Candidatus Arsenophonus lipoptenae]